MDYTDRTSSILMILCMASALADAKTRPVITGVFRRLMTVGGVNAVQNDEKPPASGQMVSWARRLRN